MNKLFALITAVSFVVGSVFLLTSVCPAQSKEDQDKHKQQYQADPDRIKAEQVAEENPEELIPKGTKRPRMPLTSVKPQSKMMSKDLIIEQLAKPPQQIGATPTAPGMPAAPQVALQPGQSPAATVPAQAGAVIFTSDAILFDYGSAQLREMAMPQLMVIAQALNDPQLANIPTFFVDGHTCDIGSDESNCWLAWERARSVMTALMSLGVPPGKIVPRGFGERDPLYPNYDDMVRAFNRRVVLKSGTVVLPRDQMLMCQAWGGYGGGMMPGMMPGVPGAAVPGVPGTMVPGVPGFAPQPTTEVQTPTPTMEGPDITATPATETTRGKKIKGFKETVVPGAKPAQQPAGAPTQQRDAPPGFKKTPVQQ